MGGPDCAVNSLGHCFFCLNEVNPVQNVSENIENNSEGKGGDGGEGTSGSLPPNKEYILFQYVSHYLGINKWKLFNRNLYVLPNQGRFQRTRILKIELCNSCKELHENVEAIFRVLERAQMELTTRVREIQRRMVKADEEGLTEKLLKFAKETGQLPDDKIELVRKARMETILKCTENIKKDLPIVKVEKLGEDFKRHSMNKEVKIAPVQEEEEMEAFSPNPSSTPMVKVVSGNQAKESKSTPVKDVTELKDDNFENKSIKKQVNSVENGFNQASRRSTRHLQAKNVVEEEPFRKPFSIIKKPVAFMRPTTPNLRKRFPKISERKSKTIAAVAISGSSVKEVKSFEESINNSKTCIYCNKTFSSKSNLNKHIANLHPNGSYFNPAVKLRRVPYNKESLHFEKSNKCQKCLKVFWSNSRWKKHKLQSSCSNNLSSQRSEIGKRNHSKEKFANPSLSSSGRKKEARTDCEICKRVLPISRLARHMRAFHAKGYSCEICMKTYPYRGSLWKHKRNKHPDQQDEGNKNEIEAEEEEVEEEEEEHADDEKYTCHECQKVFSNLYRFTMHKMVCYHPTELENIPSTSGNGSSSSTSTMEVAMD